MASASSLRDQIKQRCEKDIEYREMTDIDSKCSICSKKYDCLNVGKILPCSKYHIVCEDCIKRLIENPDGNKIDASQCVFCSSYMYKHEDYTHIKCPSCDIVFHVPENSISNLITFKSCESEAMKIYNDFRFHEYNIKIILSELKDFGKEVMEKLTKIIKKLGTLNKNCSISKISGSSAVLVGSILGILGATLALPTAGASLILTGVGAGISISGGIVCGGTGVTELVINKNAKSEANKMTSKLVSIKNKLTVQFNLLTNDVIALNAYMKNTPVAFLKFDKESIFKNCSSNIVETAAAITTTGLNIGALITKVLNTPVNTVDSAAKILKELGISAAAFGNVASDAGETLIAIENTSHSFVQTFVIVSYALNAAAIALSVGIICYESWKLYKGEPTKMMKTLQESKNGIDAELNRVIPIMCNELQIMIRNAEANIKSS